MWPLKEKEYIVAKSYPLYLAVKMCRYGSLVNNKYNPLATTKRH